jgi:hypothetical protein
MLVKIKPISYGVRVGTPSPCYAPWAKSICMTSGCAINCLFKAVLAACKVEIYGLGEGLLDAIRLFGRRPF